MKDLSRESPIDGHPVAAHVTPGKDWSEQTAARNLADELAELREISREEGYELELPPRSTRSSGSFPLNPFGDLGRGPA